VSVNAVPFDSMILDVGPQSEKDITSALSSCKTLIWNGPLGAFEYPPFDHATTAVAQAVAMMTGEGKLLSVAGGAIQYLLYLTLGD